MDIRPASSPASGSASAVPAYDPAMVVVGVNYRGSHDTLECLASLFSGSCIPRVVVADNASGDGSVERIAAWARGEIATPCANVAHTDQAARPVSFPIEYEIVTADELSRGLQKPLTIIETGGNLGFAGGNNAGLKMALSTPGVDLLWLLNNDTIVEPGSVSAVRSGFNEHPEWGIAGTQLRLYHEPARFQMVNGQRFNRLTAASTGIMAGMPVNSPVDAAKVIAETDFVCGASLVMTRTFVEQIGILEDHFFLYFEEIDLATRAKGRFATGFVADAVVYHKEGASAGSGSQLEKRARSPLAEYHLIRSKMIFCAKHYPLLLPVYFMQNIAVAARRVLRGHIPQAKAVLRASFGLPLR